MTSPANLEDQAVPLSEIIPAVAERIHYAEGRRTNFTVVAGALLAGGVAILTFIPDKNLSATFAYGALSASVGAIALGLFLLIVFARQTNRYPWTAATKTWKWFYRDALPDQKAFDPTWADLFRPAAEKTRLQAAFNSQLPQFEAKTRTLVDPKLSLEQDLQQLYVLHINEKFKNVHLSQLRSILSRGLAIVAILVLLSAAWGLFRDIRRTAIHTIQGKVGPASLNAEWRFVSASDDAGLVLAKVSVANASAESIPLPKWALVDARGVEVATLITPATDAPTKVPARTRLHYSIFLKPAEPIHVEKLVARLK